MGIGTLVAMLVTTLVVIGVLATQETYSLFLPGLLQGAWLTIQITILGALLAVVMGVLAALARLYGPAPLRWLATVYVEIFRKIPPWGNLFIELLKSTALVSLITLGDLAFRAQQMNQTTLKTVPIFTLVLLIYLVMSLAITIGMRFLEQRASLGLARGRSA